MCFFMHLYDTYACACDAGNSQAQAERLEKRGKKWGFICIYFKDNGQTRSHTGGGILIHFIALCMCMYAYAYACECMWCKIAIWAQGLKKVTQLLGKYACKVILMCWTRLSHFFAWKSHKFQGKYETFMKHHTTICTKTESMQVLSKICHKNMYKKIG